jgi:phosphoribosylformylglycinamidine cyclo-ligase
MTLARKVLQKNEIALEQKMPELRTPIGVGTPDPHIHLYRQVLKLLHNTGQRNGRCDGRGLRNFIRLKKGMCFDISKPLRPQPIFKGLQELGGIEDNEMYQTFNMGMGFAIVLHEDDAKDALRELGKGAKVVGEVVEGEGAGSSKLGLSYTSY